MQAEVQSRDELCNWLQASYVRWVCACVHVQVQLGQLSALQRKS